MAKDPAFLFYHEDFFAGVSDMSNEEVGAYIRCMCVQASKGGVSEKHMKKICETRDIYMSIISKFVLNTETDLYENARLKLEVDKRKNFVASRSQNRTGKTKSEKTYDATYVPHMENVNVNEDKGKGVQGEKPSRNKVHLERALESESWIETVSTQSSINKSDVKKKLKEFFLLLEAKMDNKINYKDFIQHFVSWLNSSKKNHNQVVKYDSPI